MCWFALGYSIVEKCVVLHVHELYVLTVITVPPHGHNELSTQCLYVVGSDLQNNCDCIHMMLPLHVQANKGLH